MKKISFTIVLLVAFSLTFSLFGQTLSVKSLTNFDNSSQPISKLLFAKNRITLNNTSLHCNEIEFSPSVKKIRIKGNVIMECENVMFRGREKVKLIITNGNLSIKYKKNYKENNSGVFIRKSNGVKLTIAKIP